MKKLILILALFGLILNNSGQNAIISGQDVYTYSGKVLTYTLPTYGTEYQAVYDAFTAKPTDAVATAQNTMVQSLVDAGVWTDYDVFYMFAAHTNDNSEALINWKNPGTNDATLTNAPAFVAFEGFTGAATKFIDLNFNPTTQGVNYTQNDMSVQCYVRTDVLEAGFMFGAINGGVNTYFSPRTNVGGDKAIFVSNAVSQSTIANADARGFYTLWRLEVNYHVVRRNKVELSRAFKTSNGLNNIDLYGLGVNNGGVLASATTRQVSSITAGASLGATKADASQDAIEVYMDSNGKGIIP